MKSHTLKKVGALAVAVAAIGGGAFALLNQSPSTAHQHGSSSYAELIALPENELSNVDIAVMNLLSAEGLPGAEGLDVKQCLDVLDQWAEVV
jgi:hypothetical protein